MYIIEGKKSHDKYVHPKELEASRITPFYHNVIKDAITL